MTKTGSQHADSPKDGRQVFINLRRLFVADMRVERRHQHERIVEMLLDALLVRLDAARAVFVKRSAALGKQLTRLEHIVQRDRPIDVQLEMPLRAGEGGGVVVAEHLHRDHGQRFALGGIDLARHDGTSRARSRGS